MILYHFYSFCDPSLEVIGAHRKSSIAFKTHIIHEKGSKGKDKFPPSYLPLSLFDIFIYAFYIMTQIITVIVLPYPTEHDNIFESEYIFIVLSISGVIIFYKRKYCMSLRST